MSETPSSSGEGGRLIAEQLRVAIRRGDYAPGDRIVQEELAERFGASRLPIRDAIRILELDGLITVVANKGAWISRRSLAECEEFYRMREHLEPLLLAYSMPRLSIATLNRMQDLAEELETSQDQEVFLRLSRQFHELSYSGATTSLLAATVQRLWNATELYRHAFTRFNAPEGDKSVHWEHRLLVGALFRQDVAEAQLLLESHIRRTRLSITNHAELFAD